MPADDPPSERELAFLAMLKRPREYARWAADVRAEWERKRELTCEPELIRIGRNFGGSGDVSS